MQNNWVDNTREALRKPKKERKWLRRLVKFFIFCVVAALLLAIGVFAYYAKDLPSPDKLNSRQVIESTKIYDRTGNHLLYEIHGEERRTQISFADMGDVIKAATISAEDQSFYQHHGVDFKSVLRAAFYDLLGRQVSQGGSTITQQLIKNTVLSPEQTFTRKVKEVILAIELEQKFTKDQILEMYLNEIPYGSNAYGVQAAAQTYFGKDAKDLTLPEAALLASLPKAPTYYSPYGSNPDGLKARQEYILDEMAKLGYVTSQEADDAKKVDIIAEIKPFQENIQAPHFVMYVKELLVDKYGEQQVEEGGMKVYTTLDWDKQQMAEDAVKNNVTTNIQKYHATNAALVAIDPGTGQILAMVGSRDYFDKSIDGNVNVAIRPRQPGSSFKPYVYATAFKKGYTPNTILYDAETNFGTKDKPYIPEDYDGKFRGPVKMQNALAESLNIPAVKTLYLAGVNNAINTAKSMGITTLNNPSSYGLSLVLGGGEVTLLDHVNAFGTFATGGVRHDKTAILKIEDPKGNILEQYQPGGTKVLDTDIAAQIDSILSNNSLRAPIFGTNTPLRSDNRPMAAKTGTTNDWRDAWTVGYTPSLVAGVWAGNNDNSPMAAGADGVYTAAPIWRAFMDKALANSAIENFPKPPDIKTGKDILDGNIPGGDGSQKIEVCKINKNTYCLANDNCPDKKKEKKKVILAHSILFWVDKSNPRGEIPSNPNSDPQFSAWEKGVQKWAGSQDNTDVSTGGTLQDCKASDFN